MITTHPTAFADFKAKLYFSFVNILSALHSFMTESETNHFSREGYFFCFFVLRADLTKKFNKTKNMVPFYKYYIFN